MKQKIVIYLLNFHIQYMIQIFSYLQLKCKKFSILSVQKCSRHPVTSAALLRSLPPGSGLIQPLLNSIVQTTNKMCSKQYVECTLNVVSIVTSQQDGPGFEYCCREVAWSSSACMGVLLVSYFGFPPQSKDIDIRLISDS